MRSDSHIRQVDVHAYTIPTETPEADGTHRWNETTLVVVHLFASGQRGVGYTYANISAAALIDKTLGQLLLGHDALSPREIYDTCVQQVRNAGRQGIAATAISAIDFAAYDLKAKLLGTSVLNLLGPVRHSITSYGSGGFTSYTDKQLCDQLGAWAREGFTAVKMKVGTHPECDLHRAEVARAAIGSAELYVDANGAYECKPALYFADRYRECGATWFEEPVSSDDLRGLHLIRMRAPAGMVIAAGEYGYDHDYFQRMMEAGAVDVMQIDGTRAGGVTGFLLASASAEAFHLPVSAHTAPTVHAHLCCAVPRARNVEYFFDHARIERMLFDGAVVAKNGNLEPDCEAPGFGFEIKEKDADQYRVYSGTVSRES